MGCDGVVGEEDIFRRESCSSFIRLEECSPKPCPSFVLKRKGERGKACDVTLGADFGPGKISLAFSFSSEVGEMASG
jgi:hypothetical protein